MNEAAMNEAKMHEAAPERGTESWQPWLLVLLMLVTAPRGIDLIVEAALHAPLGRLIRSWIVYADWAIITTTMVGSGFAVDRFGVKWTVGIGLLVWSLALGAAGLVDPAPSVLLGLVAKAAVAFIAVAPAVLAGRAFSSPRRGRAVALIDAPARMWLVIVPLLGHWAGWPPASNSAADWPLGFLVAGACGLVATLAWWLRFRLDRRAASLVAPARDVGRREPMVRDVARLFQRPMIWGYLAVFTCHAIVFNFLLTILPLHLEGERRFGFEGVAALVLAPIVILTVTQLIFGAWSDGRLARLGHVGAARQPFITAGACLTALIAFVPYVAAESLGVLLALIAVGFAMTSTVSALGLDLVPRRLHGRFFGIVFALSMIGTMAGYFTGLAFAAQRHGVASFFIVAGVGSLAAAATAWIALRGATPIYEGPDHVATISRVFS